jgi:hypothetical protein
MRQKYFWALGAVSAVAVAAYFGTRLFLAASKETKRAENRRKWDLPEGYRNYDIDGVTYDDQADEVLVSGDRSPSKSEFLH